MQARPLWKVEVGCLGWRRWHLAVCIVFEGCRDAELRNARELWIYRKGLGHVLGFNFSSEARLP